MESRTLDLTAKIVLGFTPLRNYVRADCPRYGGVAGPSCNTAPNIPTAPDLFPSLASQGVPPPPGATERRPDVPRPATRCRAILRASGSSTDPTAAAFGADTADRHVLPVGVIGGTSNLSAVVRRKSNSAGSSAARPRASPCYC